MKKLINTSFFYAMAAIVGGVFYREFTKYTGFTGRTTLAFVHLHFFVLGCAMFLVLALFCMQSNLLEQKNFKAFCTCYNIALPGMIIMFMVRGILQVLETPLSSGLNAAISGISGLVHILMTVALALLFTCLRKIELKKSNIS